MIGPGAKYSGVPLPWLRAALVCQVCPASVVYQIELTMMLEPG